METLQALQSVYKGVRYRSRAEARWAVFFDRAGIRVEYELEGYLTPVGPYLPDFYAPDLQAYFEVKGKLPTPEEYKRARALQEGSRMAVYFLVGGPQDDGYLYDINGEGPGYLGLCRHCSPDEWWVHLPDRWYALNGNNDSCCDGRTRMHTEAINAARAERFGVHD